MATRKADARRAGAVSGGGNSEAGSSMLWWGRGGKMEGGFCTQAGAGAVEQEGGCMKGSSRGAVN